MSIRKDKFSNKDIKYMNLALNLARVRHGLTGENPSVGCVIVKRNKIISTGITGYNGRPHAEYNAIKSSNVSLEGSTMYVTLEPCSHYGKTAPCTKEIIKNKIYKVIYSIEDIDNRVKGKSYKILKLKKIIVNKGLLKKEVLNFYKPYFFNRKSKMPYVTGKIAVTKNNLIYSKGIKRITDIHSDKFTHLLRYKNDSLMISSKTLNLDNPKLNCRLKGLNKFSPKRIILDNKLETKSNSYILKTVKKDNTIIFFNNANDLKVSNFRKKGIQLFKSKLTKDNHFKIKLILKKLYALGCRNLLVEGGQDLSKSLIKSKIFNQFYLYRSPKNLSKLVEYKEFSCFKNLLKNYKNRIKIDTKLGKDSITLYKR